MAFTGYMRVKEGLKIGFYTVFFKGKWIKIKTAKQINNTEDYQSRKLIIWRQTAHLWEAETGLCGARRGLVVTQSPPCCLRECCVLPLHRVSVGSPVFHFIPHCHQCTRPIVGPPSAFIQGGAGLGE